MGANAFTDVTDLTVADFKDRKHTRCAQEATVIVGTTIYLTTIDLKKWKHAYSVHRLPLPLKIRAYNKDATSPFTDFTVEGASAEEPTTWTSILAQFDLAGTAIATLAAGLTSTLYWAGLCSPDDLIRIGVKGAATAAEVDAKVVVEVG